MKVQLIINTTVKCIAYACVLVALWAVFLSSEVPFMKVATVLSPYFAAWLLISFASILISNNNFTPIWMGSYADTKIYSVPNIYYAVSFLVVVLAIYFIQYYYNVI